MWPHQAKAFTQQRRASAKWKTTILKNTHTHKNSKYYWGYKKEPLCNLGKNVNWHSHYKNNKPWVFQKLKVEQMHDSWVPFLGYIWEMIEYYRGKGKVEDRGRGYLGVCGLTEPLWYLKQCMQDLTLYKHRDSVQMLWQ